MNLPKTSPRSAQLLLWIGIILAINLFGDFFFRRIDLTASGRYSLSDYTVEAMEQLSQPLMITVYLDGDFPPNVREYQEALRTTLLEMKQYAGGLLDFEFVDPNQNPELLAFFQSRRLAPTPVQVRISPTETKTQYMWPLVRLHYPEREEVFVDMLQWATVLTPQGRQIDFVRAEADLEYKLMSAVRKLTGERSGIVALLQGHGETPVEEVPGLGAEIQSSYQLYTFDLRKVPGYEISPSIDVLVILQPTRAFSERDKYELDQYLMRGGSILWVLDYERVDMDMFRKQSTLTELYDLNLDDLFFRYGLKLNYDLIQDLACEKTEVFQTNVEGGTFVEKPWIFYPLVRDFPTHPIARNVDEVLLRYAASIDTVYQEGVRKGVFLQTSPRSRTIQGRQFIDLNEYLQSPPPPALFNQGGKIAGVVAEGVFESLFQGREVPLDSAAPQPPAATFGPRNNPIAPGRLALISDGEFAQGKRLQDQRGFMPYDNKNLIMNAIDYLAGDDALTRIRSKDVVQRRLNIDKVQGRVPAIRLLTLGLPLALLLVVALLQGYLRRRREQG
ncbi:MAG: Gldg family protein [Bacteroidia bacterium]